MPNTNEHDADEAELLILLDVNILLYAHDRTSPKHEPGRAWLDDLLASDEWIGLPWTTIWGFIRIVTNKKGCPRPISGVEAMRVIRTWMDTPRVVAVEPGPRHLELLARFVESEGATGNLTPDAVIAALAIEQGATIASTDNDFRRFGVRWVNPADLAISNRSII